MTVACDCKRLLMLENCLFGKYSAAQLLNLVLNLFLAKLETIGLIDLLRSRSETVVLLGNGFMLRYSYTSLDRNNNREQESAPVEPSQTRKAARLVEKAMPHVYSDTPLIAKRPSVLL